MKILILINDAPYGSEKAYNAMRLAMAMQQEDSAHAIRDFLMADAVTCAMRNQTTPQGYYNLERMFKSVLLKGAEVKACGSCCQARGIQSDSLVQGVEISTMQQLAQWLLDSDRTMTF